MDELLDVSQKLDLGSAAPSRKVRDMEVTLYCPQCVFLGMPLGTSSAPSSNSTPSGVVTIVNSTIVCYLEVSEASPRFPVVAVVSSSVCVTVFCAFGCLLSMLWHRVRRRGDKGQVEAPAEGRVVNPPPVVVGVPLPYAVGKPSVVAC